MKADREFADRDQAWDRVGAWVLFTVLIIGNQLMSNSAVRERQAGALDVRFANSDEEQAKAKDYVAERAKA
jgi:hypothetical protein